MLPRWYVNRMQVFETKMTLGKNSPPSSAHGLSKCRKDRNSNAYYKGGFYCLQQVEKCTVRCKIKKMGVYVQTAIDG